MAARAVLVPMQGGGLAGATAVSGLNNFSNTIQQVGKNDLARAKELIDVTNQRKKLGEEIVSRDVLQNTDKSHEVGQAVGNVYEDMVKKYEDQKNIINEEFGIATASVSNTKRNPDGSVKINPELAEKEQKRKDLLEKLDLEYSDRLNSLNKQVVAGYDRGLLDTVTNAKAYSDRVYQEAIAKGLPPEQAEALRKQEFERTKEADLTDRQKAELKLADTAYDTNNKITEALGDKSQKTVKNEANVGGTGTGTGTGSNAVTKAYNNVAKKDWEDKRKGAVVTGQKAYENAEKLYKDFYANTGVDYNEFFDGKSLNAQDISDVDTKLKQK
jgi:uncharacterized protein (UPF0333 family)